MLSAVHDAQHPAYSTVALGADVHFILSTIPTSDGDLPLDR